MSQFHFFLCYSSPIIVQDIVSQYTYFIVCSSTPGFGEDRVGGRSINLIIEAACVVTICFENLF